jgi:hypothetical protein
MGDSEDLLERRIDLFAREPAVVIDRRGDRQNKGARPRMMPEMLIKPNISAAQAARQSFGQARVVQLRFGRCEFRHAR